MTKVAREISYLPVVRIVPPVLHSWGTNSLQHLSAPLHPAQASPLHRKPPRYFISPPSPQVSSRCCYFSSRCAVPTDIALSTQPQHPEPARLGTGQAAPGAAEDDGGSAGGAGDAAALLPPLGIPSRHISSTDSPNQACGALFKA